MTNNKGRKALTITMLSLLLGSLGGWSATAAIAAPTHAAAHTAQVKHHKAKPAIKLPKCKEEDSDNCIWDAGKSGNGEGESFIAYHGHVYYLDVCMDAKAPESCNPDSNN